MSRDLATPSSDLQDYYDHIPPAHRLSDYNTLSSQNQNIPLSAVDVTDPEPYSDIPGASTPRTRPHFGDRRGEYVGYVEEKSRDGRRKLWVLGALSALVIAIVLAIILGVVLSRKSSSSSSSTSSSSGNDTISGDPSQFTKDARLKQSFWGIAYTPEGTLYPDCGAELSDVVTDMQLLSQLTTRIRVYGADCNTTALVLTAIELTKTNLTVYIANFPEADDNGEAYDRQKTAIQSAIQTYGTSHIAGVTVGNEFILDYLDDNGGTDPNSAIGDAGAEILLGFINDTKTMLSDLNVDLKIGNADAGSYFNDLVLESVDYGMANVHPWFANQSINDAAGWTWSFFETTDVALAQTLANQPDMSIAETGWPTNSTNVGNESDGPSVASEANLQIFLDTFVCQANANGTEYFFFEYFDETWKTEVYGGVEGYWGLFYSNRTLKNVEIPDCS
ncbi:glycoside hydrolase family 17 protein [Lentinula edodes]|nr:glycoside hydrolase family 17 protein [Lentinula edodes]